RLVRDHTASTGSEPRIVAQPPEHHVRVEQQPFHQRVSGSTEPSNASSISSGVSSKSSDIHTCPCHAPGTLGASCRCTGTNRASVLPYRPRTISSPAATRSSNLDSWVFASYTLMGSVMTPTLPGLTRPDQH